MNIERYFDKRFLESDLKRLTREKAIRREAYAYSLVPAHRDKAKHNLRFVSRNIADEEFNDWTVVGLYYAVYHASLALIAQRGYVSKSHLATLLLLIREYGITREEAELIAELRVTKEDAELYTELKEKRRQASYATNILFRTEKVEEFRRAAIAFVTKAEELLANPSA